MSTYIANNQLETTYEKNLIYNRKGDNRNKHYKEYARTI